MDPFLMDILRDSLGANGNLKSPDLESVRQSKATSHEAASEVHSEVSTNYNFCHTTDQSKHELKTLTRRSNEF